MGICDSEIQAKTQKETHQQDQAPIKYKEEKENDKRNPEVYTGQKPIPIDIINKASKSICKIIITINKKDITGTGFFMKIDKIKKYLVTNYHVISKDNIYNDITLEIYNHKKMKLDIDNRDIKYFEKQKDITLIEIKNNDEIFNDIEFLDYDSNYTKGYYIYINTDVFSIGYPEGGSAAYSNGKITKLNEYEFEHNISTSNGSSGCPIILLNNNINLLQVIGIHKDGNESKKINYGTFIGEIFNNNIYSEDIINTNLVNSSKNIENNEMLYPNIDFFKSLKIILIDVELKLVISDGNQKNYNSEANTLIDSDQILKFKDNNKAMNLIKKLKFFETIIIINAEKFVDFVILFNENLKNICIIPKIIIYSEKKIVVELPNNIQNKLFYTYFGIKNRNKIINFLKKEAEENKKIIADEYPQAQPDTESALIFQRIRSRGDLYLPSFYKILLDILDINDDRFIKTMKEYKDDKIYKKLFNPIISVPNIHIELLSKYYIRMYTIEGQFLTKMKTDLLIDYNKDNIIYQSYIKTLYEGLERKALKPLKTFQGIQLYSAQYFTENQIKVLNEYRLINVDYYKVPIIFSKLFLSFTKDITVAERVIDLYEKNTMLTVVEADNEYNLNTHTDIEELSCFPVEKEVLFFPFSAFGIEDFTYDSEKKIHILKLIYLQKINLILKEMNSQKNILLLYFKNLD